MNLTTILLLIAFVIIIIVTFSAVATAPAWQTIALIVAAVLVGQALGRGGE